MLASIPTENLPAASMMWINPIALGVVVFLVARVTRRFFGSKVEKAWYSLFGYGFLLLFSVTLVFLVVNEEIRNELVAKKGWFYLLSVTFPSLLFSLVMLWLSRTVKKHIQTLPTTSATGRV